MHIYELGISSLYIPNHPGPNSNGNVNTTSSQSMTTDAEEMAVAVREQRMQQEQQYHHHQQQQHQQKRARGVPLSPSPSSVLMQEECRMMSPATNGGSAITTTSSSSSGAGYVHGMDFDSPAAKRQRHVAPDDGNGGEHPTFGCSSVSVSPDRFVASQQQQPSAVIDTVSMERDDQYADAPVEWWKARPAAPPLSSTMTTSSSNTTSHSRVVGCYACQRLFVPSTATTAAAAAVPTNTLHNYFTAINKTSTTKSNSAPQPSSHNNNNNNHQCTFCERTTCQTCLRTCEQCHYAFCILCSTQDWAGSHQQQQTMCLDCCSRNKTSAAVAGTSDEGADDAMMEG